MERLKTRLEEILEKAKGAEKVNCSVTLFKQPVKYLVHPEAEITEEMEAFLYTADFNFEIDGKNYIARKTYATEFATESFEAKMACRNLANSRLKEDYKRLKDAGIEVEEKYFEE